MFGEHLSDCPSVSSQNSFICLIKGDGGLVPEEAQDLRRGIVETESSATLTSK